MRRKVALLESGVTAAQVAREVGVSRAMVSMVLSGKAKSEKIEIAVARLVGKPRRELFPTAA
jgi:predicted transcriptional regulator